MSLEIYKDVTFMNFNKRDVTNVREKKEPVRILTSKYWFVYSIICLVCYAEGARKILLKWNGINKNIIRRNTVEYKTAS